MKHRYGVITRAPQIIAFILSLSLSLAASADWMDDYMTAYSAEGYGPEAVAALKIGAYDEGDVNAASILGSLYYDGEGVPQNYLDAAVLYRVAADQGDADAQYTLGIMYDNGQGVPQAYVQAHMWINLAAVSGMENAIKGRDIVAGMMTPAQIAEAQKLAGEWKPTN